jgi:hypothetical protein
MSLPVNPLTLKATEIGFLRIPLKRPKPAAYSPIKTKGPSLLYRLVYVQYRLEDGIMGLCALVPDIFVNLMCKTR